MGSIDDSILFSTTLSEGLRFGVDSFARGEIAFSSRLNEDGFVNSLLHLEAKYYKRYGSVFFKSLYLGNHTFASSFFLDYGDRLDQDRELLIGGDNAIRGYEARTFTGDKRVAVNFEDRVHLAENVLRIVNIGAAFFFEVGGSTDENIGELFADSLYSDIGVGLRISFPRSSGARVLRFDLALPLRAGLDDTEVFEPRFLISAGQLFGADLRSEIIGNESAGVDIGFDR